MVSLNSRKIIRAGCVRVLCAQPSPAALCFSTALRQGSALSSCCTTWATEKTKARALKTYRLVSPDGIQQKSLIADLTCALASIHGLFPCEQNSCLLRKAMGSENSSYFQCPMQPGLVCETDLNNDCDTPNMTCSLCHFL